MSDDVDTSIVGEGATAHLDHQVRRLEADLRASKAALAATAERLGEVGRLLDSELISTRNATERIIQLETQRDTATERERAAVAERDAARVELAHVTEQRDRARRFAARLLLESGPHSLAAVKLQADLAAAQAEATELRRRANAPFLLKDTPIEAGAAVAVYPGMTFKLKTTLGPEAAVAGGGFQVWPPHQMPEVSGGNFDVMPVGTAERIRRLEADRDEWKATAERWRKDYLTVADAVARESNGAEDLAAKARATRKERDHALKELADAERYHHAIDDLLREFIAGIDPNGRQLALIREKLIELAALHQTFEGLVEKYEQKCAEREQALQALEAEEASRVPSHAPHIEAARNECPGCIESDGRRTKADDLRAAALKLRHFTPTVGGAAR